PLGRTAPPTATAPPKPPSGVALLPVRRRIPVIGATAPALPTAGAAFGTTTGSTVNTSTASPSASRTEDALRVSGVALSSTGLAYDKVSSRFVVADARQRKLVIIDERSHSLVDLVTSASADFFDITALEIDPLRGDLWVVSAEPSGTAPDRPPATALHKLQLVSGRPLIRVL